MMSIQVDNGGQKSHHSRSPSPAPAESIYKTQSISKLAVDQYEEVTHKSIPHLRKQRSGSDSTVNEEAGISMAASSNSSFALLTFASEKRNHEFHGLFKSVPEDERLIEDYGCALQKEILLQGRVYISEHHLCFNANIFGWITNLVIAFKDIQDIQKKSTAIIIPNALLISTATSKYFLASFLSRDQAYDQIMAVWKASVQQSIEIHHDTYKDEETFSEDDDTSEYSSSESEEELYERPQFDKQNSLASLPTPKHLHHSDDLSRRRAISEAGPRPSVEDLAMSIQPQVKEKTECECSKNDAHFATIVMDTTYCTTLEKLYHLLYESYFMTKFLGEVEKSTDISIGEWCKGDDCVQARESTYIKYLGGSIGPKSTKCYLKEQILYLDTTDYISQLTVTQTPDVPAGSSFSVKTKTCMSWSGQGQVRVLVTVLVDFTKSSWLKSTIEKASIDGQQNFYKNLDIAIRKYLDSQAPKGATVKSSRKKRKRPKEQPIPIQQPSTDKPWLQFLLDYLSGMSTSQLTAICMAIMLITNIYIASKMAGVNNQLNQLHHKPTPKPWTPPIQHKDAISDEQLEYYKLAKYKLDMKMLELSELISKTGENMDQVAQTVQTQKYQILNSEP